MLGTPWLLHIFVPENLGALFRFPEASSFIFFAMLDKVLRDLIYQGCLSTAAKRLTGSPQSREMERKEGA